MIMGADYYESDKQRADLLSAGRNPIGIGDNCTISNTIVDKNARIGANCTIVNKVLPVVAVFKCRVRKGFQ